MVEKLKINTSLTRQLIDITARVEKFVEKSAVKEGYVLVFARHTTCSIIISEVEDDLEYDLIKYIKNLEPKGPFKHSHGDFLAHDPEHAATSHTPAHLLSATVGQQVSVPIISGGLALGTWQRICLLELDGPRVREIIIQTIS